MVKVEAIKIDNSRITPLFTLIIHNEETPVKEAKKELKQRNKTLNYWWKTLIERSRAINDLHAHLTPSYYNWISVSSGIRGLNLTMSPIRMIAMLNYILIEAKI